MSVALILGCLWVIAAAVTAMLPMRLQYPPGILLLIAAPVLLLWIGWVEGWVFAVVGLFALVSMFRNPLRYFWRRFRGKSFDGEVG